ncbi:MAG: hypothetical protein IJL89_04720 [Firmicutes bacterium]|nr:hypothetical protein [Bacillota bacterium]
MKRTVFLLSLVSALLCCTAAAYAGEKIDIEVNGQTLTATLADNSSAQAFSEMLQKGNVTVEMSDYGDFEKVSSLGTTLPRNDEYITTTPGDLILYQGNSITIYYDVNSWNFTRLGKIDDITQPELKAILGKGSITAVFSLPKAEEKFIYGDVNGDGILEADDAAMVLQKVLVNTYKLPLEDKTKDYMIYVDVDKDGYITASDAAYILQKVLISSFEFPVTKEKD